MTGVHVDFAVIADYADLHARVAAPENWASVLDQMSFVLPNARVLIHQPLASGISGQATDIDLAAREILRMRQVTNGLLAKHTEQPIEKIAADVDRDFIMNAEQAKAYGLVDHVVMPKPGRA